MWATQGFVSSPHRFLQSTNGETVDGSEIRRSPDEGKIIYPHYLLGFYACHQWLFLVPLIGGRWYIILQLAVYTTYILSFGGWGVICYLPPINGNQKQLLMSGGFLFAGFLRHQQDVPKQNQPPPLDQLAAGEVKSFMKKAGCASVYLKEPWNQKKNVPHTIHVGHIYLHLPQKLTKCR